MGFAKHVRKWMLEGGGNTTRISKMKTFFRLRRGREGSAEASYKIVWGEGEREGEGGGPKTTAKRKGGGREGRRKGNGERRKRERNL